MQHVFVIFLFLLVVDASFAQDGALTSQECSTTVELHNEQSQSFGNLTITQNDATKKASAVFELTTEAPYNNCCFSKYYMDVQKSYEDFPQNNKGDPKTKDFAYQKDNLCANIIQIDGIEIDDFPDYFVCALRTEIQCCDGSDSHETHSAKSSKSSKSPKSSSDSEVTSSDPEPPSSEISVCVEHDVWAAGSEFTGKKWATFFDVCVCACGTSNCGDNGCFGTCGNCPGIEECVDGSCTDLCATVACLQKDGCHEVGACNPTTGVCSNPKKRNGSPCDDGQTVDGLCQKGVCVGSPCRACEENSCGDDGCGGTCGSCFMDKFCNVERGQCECLCETECGENDCQEVCGGCDDGYECYRGDCAVISDYVDLRLQWIDVGTNLLLQEFDEDQFKEDVADILSIEVKDIDIVETIQLSDGSWVVHIFIHGENLENDSITYYEELTFAIVQGAAGNIGTATCLNCNGDINVEVWAQVDDIEGPFVIEGALVSVFADVYGWCAQDSPKSRHTSDLLIGESYTVAGKVSLQSNHIGWIYIDVFSEPYYKSSRTCHDLAHKEKFDLAIEVLILGIVNVHLSFEAENEEYGIEGVSVHLIADKNNNCAGDGFKDILTTDSSGTVSFLGVTTSHKHIIEIVDNEALWGYTAITQDHQCIEIVPNEVFTFDIAYSVASDYTDCPEDSPCRTGKNVLGTCVGDNICRTCDIDDGVICQSQTCIESVCSHGLCVTTNKEPGSCLKPDGDLGVCSNNQTCVDCFQHSQSCTEVWSCCPTLENTPPLECGADNSEFDTGNHCHYRDQCTEPGDLCYHFGQCVKGPQPDEYVCRNTPGIMFFGNPYYYEARELTDGKRVSLALGEKSGVCYAHYNYTSWDLPRYIPFSRWRCGDDGYTIAVEWCDDDKCENCDTIEIYEAYENLFSDALQTYIEAVYPTHGDYGICCASRPCTELADCCQPFGSSSGYYCNDNMPTGPPVCSAGMYYNCLSVGESCSYSDDTSVCGNDGTLNNPIYYCSTRATFIAYDGPECTSMLGNGLGVSFGYTEGVYTKVISDYTERLQGATRYRSNIWVCTALDDGLLLQWSDDFYSQHWSALEIFILDTCTWSDVFNAYTKVFYYPGHAGHCG